MYMLSKMKCHLKKVINASEVREAIQNNNYKSVKEYLPEEVFNKAKEMMG